MSTVVFFALLFFSGFLAGIIDGEIRKYYFRERIRMLEKQIDESLERFERLAKQLGHPQTQGRTDHEAR